MSDTPESNKAKIAFTSLFANDDAYWVPFKVSRKLERELVAVTEERDELKSKYRTHHDEAERITNEIRRVSSVSRKLKQELAAVTEQRDRLAEVLNDLWHHYSLTGAAYELIEQALAAVKGGSDE